MVKNLENNLKTKLDNAPKSPGCYLWKNKYKEIIYIGKAKNIFNRIHQYFLKPNNNKTAKLISEIKDVDFITVKNNNEALILEANLIKKHKPLYNILLKENNGYPYILVTNERKPRLVYTRNYNSKLGKYYGPFAGTDIKAYEIFSLLLKLFPLRACTSKKNKKCFYYDLGLCMKACTGEDTPEQYELMKKKIDTFFNKGAEDIIEELKQKEKNAANKEDFEQANKYLKMQKNILSISQKQIINIGNKQNIDFVVYDTKDNYLTIVIFSYSNGKLLNKNTVFNEYVSDIQDEVVSYVFRYYSNEKKPDTIYISLDDESINLLRNNLNIDVINPQKGKMQEIMELALKNAKNELQLKYNSNLAKEERTTKANQKLAELLNIKKLNRIEIFDNSNIFNTDPVAGMVVYENGIPNKKEYRKYKIKIQSSKSDYEYMYEIIYRRFLKLLKEKKAFPDLVILDGGRVQINAALKALRSLNIEKYINLIGLVKDKHHKTNMIETANYQKIELDKKSGLYFYLLNMQEEVHRYAISFFRKTNRKSALSSVLDNVKNLGKVRKEKLMSIFDTVSKIADASIEQLAQIIPIDVAKELKNKIQKMEK